MDVRKLNEHLGNIDIYLLDQILKGRFDDCQRILDAGCGEGRNSRYLASSGKDIYFIDKNESAVQMVRMLFRQFPSDHFFVGDLKELPFKDQFFSGIICSAVLHFADTWEDFEKMWKELVRVLEPGGLIFIRMSSYRGLDHKPVFPYSLGAAEIEMMESDAEWVEPFKTVLVEDRSMAVLTMRKK